MPVTSPHAIYGTGGGYPECTFSMVWPSERTQYTDAENIKGKKKTIKSLFCGRGFGCYHTAIVLQRARPSCGSDDQVKIVISSPAGDLKTVSSIRSPVGPWPLATLEMPKKLGRVSFRQGFWHRYWSPVIYWPIFLLSPVTFPAWPSG